MIYSKMTDEEETEVRITSHKNKERNRQQNVSQKRTRSGKGSQYKATDFKYKAESAIKLIVPVSLCMLIVIFSLSNIIFYTEETVPTGVSLVGSRDSKSNTIWTDVIEALIGISSIIIMSLILIALYVYKFYKVLFTWFVLITLIILFFFGYNYSEYFLKSYNLPMDIFTIVLLLWNFGATGVICLHWKGPLKLRQAYLILTAARVALVIIKVLTEWTTWILLFLVSIWDIVAVLAPVGPLKILVETSYERKEPLFPSLIYSTVVYSSAVAIGNDRKEEEESDESTFSLSTAVNANERSDLNQRSDHIETANTESPNVISGDSRKRKLKRSKRNKKISKPSEDNVQLGLGDFIFYSVLVGKAYIHGTWISVLACYVAILVGLCVTFILLLRFRKVLPALPISVVMGLVFHFFFGGARTVPLFLHSLEIDQIFI